MELHSGVMKLASYYAASKFDIAIGWMIMEPFQKMATYNYG